MVQSSVRLPEPAADPDATYRFMLQFADDTEDAPWMVMGDLQFWSASALAHSLRIYARTRGLPWYVASMLPIRYTWPGIAGRKQVAPDIFVASVPDHSRTSYDVAAEGLFPPFVLEVVSPSSTVRDRSDKLRAYELLGVQEYVLFTPKSPRRSLLEGYRRAPSGHFEAWTMDAHGRLWSALLGLFFVVNGRLLQAQTLTGEVLLDPDQADAARQAAEAAREQAEAARHEAEAARHEAEAEVERLRRELARLAGRPGPAGGAESA